MNRDNFLTHTPIFNTLYLKVIPSILLGIALTSCGNNPPKPQAKVINKACLCDDSGATSEQTPTQTNAKDVDALADYSLLKTATWEQIDGFNNGNLSLAWPAWLQSCSALKNKPQWSNVCNQASLINAKSNGTPSNEVVMAYFKAHFKTYQANNADGTDTGLITGYYEPFLKGSHTQSSQYPYPLYTPPPDLLTVALNDLYPELKHKRLRGQIKGNKLVPYLTRAEIDTEPSPIKDQAFVFINDIVDVFFLHIQGSGLVELDTGEKLHIGYADQNGHPYRSIGKLLIANNELKASEASMQGIKNWGKNNPSKLKALLNSNPSYVFFRELAKGLPGPLGALGVPLLAEQAVAVDKKFIPLGAPVFLSTTAPNSNKPLKKLMMAQDTGGAIRGGVRADFYWGSGFKAGDNAGSMKQQGKIWVLLPKEFVLPKTN